LNKLVFIIFLLFISLSIRAEEMYTEDKYSKKEKEYMLNLARQSISWYLKYNVIPKPNPDELTENLKENRPCFVTLTKRDFGLRGCIGTFEFNSPLYKNIISRAIASATQDIRFLPVEYDELKDIKIEISILTEPKKLDFVDPQDLLNKLTPNQDGVILYTEYGPATYLPQVWEQLPDKELFLSSLCNKAGAPSNYWKTNYKNLKVEIYRAIHFEENIYGKKIIGPYGAVVGKKKAKVLGVVSLEEDITPYTAEENEFLEPATIVSYDSDIIEKKTPK